VTDDYLRIMRPRPSVFDDPEFNQREKDAFEERKRLSEQVQWKRPWVRGGSVNGSGAGLSSAKDPAPETPEAA
jgi:hypothetical protein